MALSETIVGELTYYKDHHSDKDPEYTGRESMIEIMRDGDSDVIEIAMEPDAQSKTVDRIYCRIPADVLMAALTKVLLGQEKD